MKRALLLSALAAPLLVLTISVSHADTTCKDGTTSTSTGKGSCSGHGGVQKTVTTCKDGTTSTSKGKGSCSGHGGVQKAAKPAA